MEILAERRANKEVISWVVIFAVAINLRKSLNQVDSDPQSLWTWVKVSEAYTTKLT